LLVDLLDLVLHVAYEVKGEVPVGTMPLRVDIVLIRRLRGRLPKSAARELAALLPRLNRHTLIEFKGPTDALRRGDMDALLAHAHLYVAQSRRPIDHRHVSLIVIAPRLNRALRDDISRHGFTIHDEEPGIHRIDGPVFSTWVVETAVAVGASHPLLSVTSPVFLKSPDRIIEELRTHGYEDLLDFMLQRIRQFESAGKAFAMQHTNLKEMRKTFKALREQIVEEAPIQVRLRGLSPKDRLEGLSPEARLEGLSPEARLEGLSPEARLEGLSANELDEMRQLIEHITKKSPTKRRKN